MSGVKKMCDCNQGRLPCTCKSAGSEQKMTNELLPCPFCGLQDAFVEQLDSDASVVICQGRVDEHSACLARGPVGVQQQENEDQPGRDEAIKEWNRRAQPATQPQGEPAASTFFLVSHPNGSSWTVKNGDKYHQMAQRLDHLKIEQLYTDSGEVDRLRTQLAEAQAELSELEHDCSGAAIQFALENDEGLTFLRLWNEGEFDVLRCEWPEAPDEVYDGADPLYRKSDQVIAVTDIHSVAPQPWVHSSPDCRHYTFDLINKDSAATPNKAVKP